jgi:hypothetical protein
MHHDQYQGSYSNIYGLYFTLLSNRSPLRVHNKIEPQTSVLRPVFAQGARTSYLSPCKISKQISLLLFFSSLLFSSPPLFFSLLFSSSPLPRKSKWCLACCSCEFRRRRRCLPLAAFAEISREQLV